MRVLLDESLPRPLARLLTSHDVRTVTQMRWTGLSNGALLQQASDSFDVLLTADQSIEFQQNLKQLPMAVLVLVAPTNRIESLEPLIQDLLKALETLRRRQFVRVGAF